MRAILMYHSIDASGSPISVSASAFAAHVAWLSSGAVRVLPLDAIATDQGPGDAVALTFDDGFANFAQLAWPLLQARGLPATVFVVSGHAGGTNAWGGKSARGIPELPLLSWDEVGALAAQGVTIGAHSQTHPDLRTVNGASLDEEIEGSAAEIAARIGRRPDAFAYPYGAADDRVVHATRTRYARAVTVELRDLADGDDPHRLPRVDTYYFREPGQLEAWGTPAFRRRLTIRAIGRQLRALATGSR